MPQMSPLYWWLLFIYFIVLLILFSILNYYIISYNSPTPKTSSFSKMNLNWKW
uniref:ATP synthase complex subunit 8 n=1 Tax=Polystoechotes punctata TaxID=2028677 RepID=B5U4F2_9NEOP|nr:ATP synthase F0 subunit 8 [Polystoechotes punctata]ACH90004.1 ATP synthase F0 subunit 8 [Polystoechotes punctata]